MVMIMLCVCVITEALSACHYIPEVRSNVFNILYHALNSENAELQQASHQCMKRVSCVATSCRVLFCQVLLTSFTSVACSFVVFQSYLKLSVFTRFAILHHIVLFQKKTQKKFCCTNIPKDNFKTSLSSSQYASISNEMINCHCGILMSDVFHHLESLVIACLNGSLTSSSSWCHDL